eukprot:452221-Alexandrium_andersonii.AAC.1
MGGATRQRRPSRRYRNRNRRGLQRQTQTSPRQKRHACRQSRASPKASRPPCLPLRAPVVLPVLRFRRSLYCSLLLRSSLS